jgi:dephospho-CoA kinase
MSRVVGLSGGIGSGKSTVSQLFAELGAVIVDADAIVHELQAAGTPLAAEIAAAFGPDILASDGSLDRKALGDIVFADKEKRAELGRLVHPRVGAEMFRRTQEAQDSGRALILLDIPLLFEGRAANTGTAARMGYDETVLVWVPAEVQVLRTIERDGCTPDEAQARINAQMPIDDKKPLADHIIDNSGTLEETRAQVERVFAELVAEGA